jgi:hypothetical protein
LSAKAVTFVVKRCGAGRRGGSRRDGVREEMATAAAAVKRFLLASSSVLAFGLKGRKIETLAAVAHAAGYVLRLSRRL